MVFEYIERDGLLYPLLDVDDPQKLADLGKYGLQRLTYLKLHKPDFFMELVRMGKLAEHCEQIEEKAFKKAEEIQAVYIARNPLPEDDFWMRVSIRMMAQMVADEVVQFQVIEG